VTSAASYAVGDLLARPGSQVRGNCLVNLGASTVSLPVAITHGSATGPVLAITAGIGGAEYVPIVTARLAGLAIPRRGARPAGTNGHPAGRCLVAQPVRRHAAGAPGCRPAARRRPRSRAPLDLPTG
jgi:hypothetical protein